MSFGKSGARTTSGASHGWFERLGRMFWRASSRKAWSTSESLPSLTPGRAAVLAPSFYASREWRRARYECLRRWGARCSLCGRTSKHGTVIHVDHIVPRSREPALALVVENLQPLCEDCNFGKGNKDSIDWRRGGGIDWGIIYLTPITESKAYD